MTVQNLAEALGLSGQVFINGKSSRKRTIQPTMRADLPRERSRSEVCNSMRNHVGLEKRFFIHSLTCFCATV